MFYRYLLLSLLLASSYLSAQPKEIGNLICDGIPAIPDRIAERMSQYQNVRTAHFSDWNPHGPGMLISTRFGETNQIHYVAYPGGSRQQLTFFKEPVSDAAYCPDPAKNGFLFSMDKGGGEFYQILWFDLATNVTRLITDGKARNTGPRWSADGKKIAFSSNLRNNKDMDIRLTDLERPGVSEPITQAAGEWQAVDFSPDQAKLLVRRYVSINESYLYVCDLATKKLTQINAHLTTKIAYGNAKWSKDGKGIFYTADEMGEFLRLFYYDDLGSNTKIAISEEAPWDVSAFTLAPDGSKLAYLFNEGGVSSLRVLDLKSKEKINLPPLVPMAVVWGMKFSPNGQELALTITSPQTPGDVYTIALATATMVRWTFSETAGLKADNFVLPRLVHYPTFDEVEGKPRLIPAFYYLPHKAETKLPVVIAIHGGPEGQDQANFNSTYQYLANELQIAVLAPNVRGSTGYGKTYLLLDNGYQREDSVKDIGALLAWISRQPDLDAQRVGVYGGSYGGYMVLSAMCYFNERLRAGVDIVGISSLVTFLERTQEYRRDLRRAEYGDERDPKMREFLLRIAPTTNAANISKPLFVAQGLNDPRVPASESEQMVSTVRQNGNEVWYLLAKNEGHGFRKKSNRDYYLNAMMLFWEKFLLQDQ